MTRGILIALASASVLVLAACGTGTGSATASAGASALAAGGGDLTGQIWQWTAGTTKVPASQTVVPDPENYTIEFKTDGTYSAKADCNQVSGSYTSSGDSLTLTAGASTLAACDADSSEALFLAGLAATTTFAVSGSELVLTQADEATMTFQAR
jgi:heat shock protein HslJ